MEAISNFPKSNIQYPLVGARRQIQVDLDQVDQVNQVGQVGQVGQVHQVGQTKPGLQQILPPKV